MFKRLTIELTNVCDLSCHICPRHHINMDLGYITKDLWLKIINQLPPDTTIFPFWRGESLLHPDVVELLELALWKRLQIVLATNGHFIQHLPKDLISRMKAISVSLHDMKSYEAYQWLVNETDCPEIQASCVVGERPDIPLKILATIKTRNYTEHTILGEWGATSLTKTNSQPWCRRLDIDLVITWDGKVSRCCYVWETINNLNANTTSLEDIWKSPQLLHIASQYPDNICQNCDQWRGNGRTL